MYRVCVDSNTLFVSITVDVECFRAAAPFLLQEPPGPPTGGTSVTVLAVVVCVASCCWVQSLGGVSCEGTATVQGVSLPNIPQQISVRSPNEASSTQQ